MYGVINLLINPTSISHAGVGYKETLALSARPTVPTAFLPPLLFLYTHFTQNGL
jgi:hypothetical protein